jgi:hypothetical protein
MKLVVLSILGATAATLTLGCGNGGASDQLLPGPTATAYSTDSLAAGKNTFNHPLQPNNGANGVVDPILTAQANAQIGTPDVVARLHGAQKLPVSSLSNLLSGLGVNMNSSDPASAAQIYANGLQALGAPIYASRVPEMIIPSTASLTKEYDVLVAAAPEILTNISNSVRCPGVVLLDKNGQFTTEGITCLLGKPALPDHVTIANNLVGQAPDQTTGQELAIATLLEAAHTSE